MKTLHPGVIADTNLARNLGVLMRALAPIARLFTKTIPQGAATQCYLAAHAEVASVTGQYFSDCKIAGRALRRETMRWASVFGRGPRNLSLRTKAVERDSAAEVVATSESPGLSMAAR